MSKEINREIGVRLRARRTQLRLSREKLSELLGVSTRFLASVESGEAGMSLTTFKAVCLALDVTADELLFGNSCAPQDPARERLTARVEVLAAPLVPLAQTMLDCLEQAANK